MAIVGYTFCLLIGRIISVVNLMLLADSMKTMEFGLYAFLQSTVSLIATVTTFNLTSPIAVVLARGSGPRQQLENSLLLGILALTFALAVLASLATFWFALPDLFGEPATLIWFSLLSGTTGVQVLSNAALIARGGRARSASSGLLSALISVGAILILRPASLTEALQIAMCSLFVGTIWTSWGLFSEGFLLHWKSITASFVKLTNERGRSFLRFSVASFGTSILLQWGLWFLQRRLLIHGGAEESAVFALSNQFYNLTVFVPTILGPILLRHLSLITDEREQIRTTWRFGLSAVIAGAVAVSAFVITVPILSYAIPSKYQIGAGALIFAVSSGALMFAKFPFSVFFQAKISGGPELMSSLVAVAVIVCGAFDAHISSNAVASLSLRTMATGVYFAAVLTFFWISSRKRNVS